MNIVITVALLLLAICAGGITIWLDRRQQQIDRQIANALPETATQAPLHLRRQQTKTQWTLIHRLINYHPEITFDWSPVYLVLASVVVGLSSGYAIKFLGFPVWYILGGVIVTTILTMRGLFGWQTRTFKNRLFRQLPDVIQMVTSTVRAGLPVAEAFKIITREMPEPTSGQFALVCSDVRLGIPSEQAVENIYHRTHLPEYSMFAVTLAVQLKSGGNLSETLQTLGETVRQRVGLALRAKALAAEVIFSARALSIAPFATTGLFYVINPSLIDMLFNDPRGHKMLAYAGVSVFLGICVIRWMVRKETTV